MNYHARAAILLRFLGTGLLAGSGLLLAQGTAPAGSAAAAASAAEAQRLAVAAMQKSVEIQRVTVQKQLGSTASAGFFVLPPPVATTTPSTKTCDPLPEGQISALVDDAAERQDVDPELLRTVMRQESGFRPCAVSRKGAAGLMQLMPATAGQLGVRDVWQPAENVDAGAKLLKQMLTRYHGDLEKSLAAYNAGPSAVDAADGVPRFSETLDYIRQIMSFMHANQ